MLVASSTTEAIRSMKRLVEVWSGTALTVALWLWAGARGILDWLGRGVVVTDLTVPESTASHLLRWFLSTPWYVPALLATVLTGVVIYLLLRKPSPAAATPAPEVARTAECSMRVFGDDRIPEEIVRDNIWRWYWLRQTLHGVDAAGALVYQGVSVTVFLSFDNPVAVGTLRVQSPDIRLPPHEVKEFNNRFAIIAFMADVPAGTLNFSAV